MNEPSQFEVERADNPHIDTFTVTARPLRRGLHRPKSYRVPRYLGSAPTAAERLSVLSVGMPGRVLPRLSLVAPGTLLSSDEIRMRFGSVPLEDYRRAMPPEVFKLFVRFSGIVASPSADVVALTRPEEP